MKTDNISIVLLHEYPDYVEACATLLNSQWKRSSSARIHTLNKSCKDLPDSLVLLEEANGEKEVIGHCRLTRIMEDENGCFIESVIIYAEKRNKGYGKYLMFKAEEYAKQLNFSTVYLSTHDQQGFYEHLGYVYSEPVSSVKFSRGNHLVMNSLFSFMTNERSESKSKTDMRDREIEMQENYPIPKVPLPPPPLLQNKITCMAICDNTGKYWMKKPL
ncbi:n-alpha-acetyltransferase 80 [Caerostris extrusa]|uniref:N-alpha-acetyltransferase 80 n=1 Tax=Caerostris extrusa TaxID=172846 RepID=A0AAV4RJY4_CAEEX|nr:n-alpha-acetyltransferase 80 [Caerostris extrusa]